MFREIAATHEEREKVMQGAVVLGDRRGGAAAGALRRQDAAGFRAAFGEHDPAGGERGQVVLDMCRCDGDQVFGPHVGRERAEGPVGEIPLLLRAGLHRRFPLRDGRPPGFFAAAGMERGVQPLVEIAEEGLDLQQWETMVVRCMTMPRRGSPGAEPLPEEIAVRISGVVERAKEIGADCAVRGNSRDSIRCAPAVLAAWAREVGLLRGKRTTTGERNART